MNTLTRNKLDDLQYTMWNFVHDYQVGNLSDIQIDMPEGIAIHNIIEAAESIVLYKPKIQDILNK